MAGPITWRNVQGSAGNSAASLLNSGQNQVQQSLQTLQNLLATSSKDDVANAEALKNLNTQQYLDKVAATDLNTLATEEGRAALLAERGQFGAGIDQGATRNAIDQRLAQARQSAMQEGQFSDFETERSQREAVDQLRGLAASGNQAEVENILNSTQFLDEGKLRQELTGVFDNTQQREYRANAEGRAQRGEQRSAASHALNMEAGRENLGYSRAMHGESLRKLSEDRAADSIAMEAFTGTQNATEAQSALVADIAKANGLTMKEDGSIDVSKEDQEVQDRVAQQLQDAGAGGNTATAARQRIVEMAKQNGLGTEATQQALARYDTVRAFDDLAPEDQAKVQTEVADATRPLAATEKKLTDTFNRKSKENPFLAPSNDVTADSNSIVEDTVKKYDGEWFATDINRKDLGKQITDILQNGVNLTLDGENFTGVIPPSLIKRALLETTANIAWSEGTSVRNLIEDYVKDNKGIQRQMKEAPKLIEQFQQDIGKINGEKLKIENSITRARKKEKGVTVSNNDWVDALIRRRAGSGN